MRNNIASKPSRIFMDKYCIENLEIIKTSELKLIFHNLNKLRCLNKNNLKKFIKIMFAKLKNYYGILVRTEAMERFSFGFSTIVFYLTKNEINNGRAFIAHTVPKEDFEG